MRKLTSALAIGAVIAAAGGTALVARAETSGPGVGPSFMLGHMAPGMMGMRGGPQGIGVGDPSTHLAALKRDLGINPEQAAAWDAYAKVVQDSATQMLATRKGIDMDAVHSMSSQDRQAFMTKMRDQHEQAFGALKTAAETLLPSLDDAQKAKAKNELPGLVAHASRTMHHAGMGMMGGLPMMGGPFGPETR
jgi:hypothetical protein